MKTLKLQEQNQQRTGPQPYEPPKAIFVPMKLEERMMYCGKGAGSAGGGCLVGCK